MVLNVSRFLLPGRSLNRAAIEALHQALDAAEADATVRIFALEGGDGVFCDGMDFGEATTSRVAGIDEVRERVGALYQLFERFTTSPKIVVALVDGRTIGGGVGLVAASDVAIATPASSFQLSEILFGLLPATVAPFLLRRTGFQAAYRMSLTAERIDAAQALACHLIDTITDAPAEALRRLMVRIDRTAPRDVAGMKRHFQAFSALTDATRVAAIDAITARITDPAVMQGIRQFLGGGGLPWRTP